jgi:hypothetical protein
MSKKKLIALLAGAMCLTSFLATPTSAGVLEDAIQRGYDEGLTQYRTTSTFRPYDRLRRDEAAKFFVQFAQYEGYRNTEIGGLKFCSFYDTNNAIWDLRDFLTSSCEYNIFLGSNGYFYPSQELTNAQAVTVVVRILDGIQSEYGLTHWADNYYTRARQIGLDISKFSVKDNPTTRGNVMMLIYDAVEGTSSSSSSSKDEVEDILQDLLDILEE